MPEDEPSESSPLLFKLPRVEVKAVGDDEERQDFESTRAGQYDAKKQLKFIVPATAIGVSFDRKVLQMYAKAGPDLPCSM